ncbi:podocalyxin-like protein 2 isoform X1 [Brachyistius frenatus]|uniref:podocalyxin-like protein 2 isoform X1 n=1 Tax=Brachyistius frenatus TaxID=100188 RepID=UPI0037E71EB6
MPGLLLLITLTASLAGCEAFRLGSSQRVVPLDEARLIQELVRTKRSAVHELVRAQPHLVHDMGWPEIHETSRSQAKMESANSSQLNAPRPAGRDAAGTHESLDVEDEMERMVHLAVPQDADDYRGNSDSTDPETEHVFGPGPGDASREASGFYGTDAEDRDRVEDMGEDRERRGGEDEWEAREDEDGNGGGTDDGDVRDASEANHTTPDLDALIGYTASFHPSTSKQPSITSPAEVHRPGLQEHRASPVLEVSTTQVSPLGRELWEAEGEEDIQSSGYGVLHSSISTTTAAAVAPSTTAAAVAGGDVGGTATPETDTGTDFGLLGTYTKDETEDEETEREEDEEETGLAHIDMFTQNPTAPEVGSAPSREPLQPSVEEEEQLEEDERELKGFSPKDRSDEAEEENVRKTEREGTRVGHVVPLTTDPSPTVDLIDPSDWLDKNTPLQSEQVVCKDWSKLDGRGYVVLNMTENLNCEEFRVDQGVRLLRIIERVFARRMNSPEGSWVITLSKPTHQQHQLLMNVESENGVISTTDVLDMLREITNCLNKVGIQNYSAASSCPSRPSQTRSDYGKLFVVLVIIGSICMVIITSGFIYICWQRRLPATKTTFRGDELHFVENGCHDNPTLDVTNDGHPEMREKKPSTNGLSAGGEGGGGGGGDGDGGSRWQVFVNQAATEEEEEEEEAGHTSLIDEEEVKEAF